MPEHLPTIKGLDLTEFAWGSYSSNSGPRFTHMTRHSRAEKLTGSTVFVKDKITNIRLEETIPLGHYSRKKVQDLRYELLDKLFIEIVKLRKSTTAQ